MIFPNNLTLSAQDIERRGVLRDPETQLIRSRVGFTLSLYFTDGHQPEKRQQLVDALGEYLELVGDEITHFKHGDDGRLHKILGPGVPEQYQRSVNRSERDMFYIHVRQYDSRERNDPKLHMFMAFGEREGPQWPLSGLKVYLPPSLVFGRTDRVVQYVRGWCERLGVIHGSGGLGVLTNPGSETMGDAYYYPWLSEYQALDYDAMGNFLATVSKGGWERPRSSNWLTVLGDDNVSALGGEDKFVSDLSGDVKTVRYKNGVILLAGEQPVLGDARGGIPEAYRKVAQLIKPIRFEDYRFAFIKLPGYLDTGKERRMAENLKWLRRLDY